MSLTTLKSDLRKVSQPEKREVYQRFFKTGKGEYGEGDIFIGVTVPNSRKVAKRHKDLPLNKIQKLLQSKIHEERLVALLILVEQFETAIKINNSPNKPEQSASPFKTRSLKAERAKIVKFYLKNTKHVNNWDLVDLSAHKIVGAYLFDKDRKILFKLAKSISLWERRIAVIATFYFIHNNDFKDALKISKTMLNDKHDLIHKAVGWMLREVGKKDRDIEERFLRKHYKIMPRTMLRYAIERFPEPLRQKYLKGTVAS